MRRITEFYGVLRLTPVYGKCHPITVYGHWTLKDSKNGKPYRIWCNENSYKNGINENICEIIRVDRIVKEDLK